MGIRKRGPKSVGKQIVSFGPGGVVGLCFLVENFPGESANFQVSLIYFFFSFPNRFVNLALARVY